MTLSQAKLHAPFGGVFPNLAKREHIKNLPEMLPIVLKDAGIDEKKPEIDIIAVTTGPGLEPCLWTGISFAEKLAEKWGAKIIPTNHMEGHIFSALLRAEKHKTQNYKLSKLNFPSLALLISGGHTELDLIESYGKYKLIGETRDDAVGEAFDKVARLLGLPYPGGPEISRLAEQERKFNGHRVSIKNKKGVLPRPMLNSDDFDFSFSGIKTAVLYLVKKLTSAEKDTECSETLSVQTKAEITREFEDAVTEVLVVKTMRAVREYGAQTLIVAGGVIANTHIREEFEKLAQKEGVKLLIPEIPHTTDNALMIAVAAYANVFNKVDEIKSLPLRADGTAKISGKC
jgi:N6-L-threonylcarbamoyladenine synthase